MSNAELYDFLYDRVGVKTLSLMFFYVPKGAIAVGVVPATATSASLTAKRAFFLSQSLSRFFLQR
jgi:hypothetical protein